MGPDEWAVSSLRRVEKLLWWLRFVFTGVVTGMTVLSRPASFLSAIAVIVVLLVLNLALVTLSPWLQTAGSARALGLATMAIDGAAALAVFCLFPADPAATPAALMPFFAFELALRTGPRGAALGLGLGAVAFGIQLQGRDALAGGTARLPILLLWAFLTIVMAALGQRFQIAEAARLAALREQNRIAERFRSAFAQALDRGAATDETARGELLTAIERVARGQDPPTADLAARIALLLAIQGYDYGLSHREREVLALLAKGYSPLHIAAVLFMTPCAVRSHVLNIMGKLDLGLRSMQIRRRFSSQSHAAEPPA